MKTRTYEFKSILQKWRELPQTDDQWAAPQKEYDLKSVREHRLELGARDIVTDRSWGSNFFIALMSASALCVLSYGLLRVGFSVAFRGAILAVFIVLSLLVFCALWALFSIRGAVNNRKRQVVLDDRGKGDWIIIDADRWDRFYRIITAPKKNPADPHARP